MELTKIPGPMRVIWGSIGAWWVGQLLNPGFFSVAILMLCLIPVLVFELYFHVPRKITVNRTVEPAEPTEAEATSPTGQSHAEDTE